MDFLDKYQSLNIEEGKQFFNLNFSVNILSEKFLLITYTFMLIYIN